MKRTGILAAGVLFLATAFAFTLSNLWTVIDADKVVVNFSLKKDGAVGTFTGIDASIDFNESDLSKSSIKATIMVNTINTKNKQRDGHILTPDFFDAAKYPTITFVSTSISKTEKGYSAKGQLTMKDKTMEVEVPFTFVTAADGTSSLNGTMTVSPYQFGVMKDSKAKDEVATITVNVPLKK